MWYERACRIGGRLFPWFKGEPEEDFYDYIDFTGLDIRSEDARALAYGVALALAVVLFLSVLAVFSVGGPWVHLLFVSLICPIAVLYYLGNYPKIYAENQRVKAFITMPETISNMAISLKTVPNLEKAVEFAALKTRGQMGVELRKMIWDTHMRVYPSLDEALERFSDKWKKFNSDFFNSLYLIKGSLMERNEEKRLNMIDRAVEMMLAGTLEKMDAFARSLNMPTLSLYFVGMILPLVMIAVLPALSYVGASMGVRAMFLLYNILIPLAVYLWSRRILSTRPMTSMPLEIPIDCPDIPPRGTLMFKGLLLPVKTVSVFFTIAVSLPFFFSFVTDGIEEPTFLGFNPTLFLIWGSAIGLSVYFLGTTFYHSRIRDEIKEMEEEFVEAISQLGSRISEGRPIEDAFIHVGNVMGRSKIGRVFREIGDRLLISRRTLRSSLLDPEEGALRTIYSPTIRDTMEMIADSADKGSRATSEMLFRTRDHFSKLREMDKRIERRLGDVVSSLRSTVLFFGPFMAGVVVTIQRMMNARLSEIKISSPPKIDSSSLPFAMDLRFDKLEITTIPVGLLQLIVGFYLLEMVVIFSFFMSELYVGDDEIFKRRELGKNLVIAVVIFSFAISVSQAFLQ
jgi:Flp pilus assembly protein TadB